ncbi:MAG: OmpA family protein [Kofleriaceae bacterium]
MQRALTPALILVAACGATTSPPPPASPDQALVLAAPAEPAPAEPAPAAIAAPAPAPLEPATATLTGGEIVVSAPVVYETGSADIAPAGEPALVAVDELLDAKPDVTLIRIEVHTDASGADAFNQRMSEQRALAVARWLVAHGVDCHRLIPVGFGETKPVDSNQTAAGRAANRRTLFIPAALRGKLIGGLPADGGGAVAGDPCP